MKIASHIVLGKSGEEFARQYLEDKGYEVLEINWRNHHKEVDIICQKERILVFVEVKTRTDNYFQQPFEAVETEKQHHLCEAAEAYMEDYHDFDEIRFDIISVIKRKDSEAEIEHIEEAFIPGIDN